MFNLFLQAVQLLRRHLIRPAQLTAGYQRRCPTRVFAVRFSRPRGFCVVHTARIASGAAQWSARHRPKFRLPHYLAGVAYLERSIQTGIRRIWNRRSSIARGKCIPISFERQTRHDCWTGTDATPVNLGDFPERSCENRSLSRRKRVSRNR